MARPARNACSEQILSPVRVFFATTKTSMGRCLLQSERNEMLLIDVLRCGVLARKFQVNDFVVMPDHVHLLLTLDGGISIEKAMQLIKGGFSYRLKKEAGYVGEVWQRGFSEVRVGDRQSWLQYRKYIAENPMKAGLCDSPGQYPYCFTSLARRKREQGLKPAPFGALAARLNRLRKNSF